MRILILVLMLSFCSGVMAKTPLIMGYSDSHISKVFGQERRYMVALPEQYQVNSRHYPTLYIIDADFQFQHVAATVNNLARMGKIPPMIVVGIATQGNQDYLKSNTWPSEIEGEEFGGAAIFAQYLQQELIPLIEQTYRTNTQRALAGYSLGGLTVMQNLLDETSPFNAFLAFSPSLWYDDYGYKKKFEAQVKNINRHNKPLFISLANEQGMGVRPLVELLKNKSLVNFKWQFKEYPKETHYSTALPALYDGLLFLAPDYFIDLDQMMKQKDYLALFALFEAKKSLWTGFNFEWLQSYTLSKYFFASKQSDSIPEALNWIKEHFADSYNEVLINFALGYNKKQQAEQAKNLLLSIEKTSLENAKWHYQIALSYQQLGDNKLASQHHQQALQLAQIQQLESWEYWELEPYLSF